jgi:hypothetical protein
MLRPSRPTSVSAAKVGACAWRVAAIVAEARRERRKLGEWGVNRL